MHRELPEDAELESVDVPGLVPEPTASFEFVEREVRQHLSHLPDHQVEDHYIADIQQIYIDDLDGKPPTDDLCIGYAISAMKDAFPWYQVLRDGILEHELLRPIIDRVLSYLVLRL